MALMRFVFLPAVLPFQFARVDLAFGDGHHALGEILEPLKRAFGFLRRYGWHDQSRYRVAAPCQSTPAPTLNLGDQKSI